jgi:hypothetical protein
MKSKNLIQALLMFSFFNLYASQGVYIEDDNKVWGSQRNQDKKKTFVPFDLKIEEESITEEYIKKSAEKKDKSPKPPKPDSKLTQKIKSSVIYPKGPIQDLQRLTGGYRKLSILGGIYQNVGTAKAHETQLNNGKSTSYNLFELKKINYDTIFQIGMAFGTANPRFRGEYEISYIELGGVGKVDYDKTDYVSGANIEVDKKSLQLGIANLSWNNYINIFRYRDYEFFLGLGIGASFVFPKSKNLESNFAVPTLQFMAGTGFDIGSNAKMNLIYRLHAMDLNLYHKLPYTNNGTNLNNDRAIDNSYTNYRFLIQMIGVEIMAF